MHGINSHEVQILREIICVLHERFHESSDHEIQSRAVTRDERKTVLWCYQLVGSILIVRSEIQIYLAFLLKPAETKIYFLTAIRRHDSSIAYPFSSFSFTSVCGFFYEDYLIVEDIQRIRFCVRKSAGRIVCFWCKWEMSHEPSSWSY